MDYGFFGFNAGGLSTPDSMERVVVIAEKLGFESVWTAEHVVLIDPQQDPSPIPAESNTVDTIASLAFAGAKTERIKLGTGILLLPQRDPIVLAKELAGVDVLSKGRLLFGLRSHPPAATDTPTASSTPTWQNASRTWASTASS